VVGFGINDVEPTGSAAANSMEQSSSGEDDSRSAGQEIPCLLWNPYFCVHMSLPPQ
jgi:hypothetical protein